MLVSRLELPTGVSGGVAAAAGAGAAGGIGFALMGVCGAVLKNGFDIVAGVDWNLHF
jgi:glycerate kinase